MKPRVRSGGRSGSPGAARSVDELVVVQRHGAGVEQVQHDHREHGAGEHGHRAEHPHEQRRGEVERPEPQRPEVAAPDHRALHVARRRVRPQRGHEEAGVHVVPRGLDEAGEGGHQTSSDVNLADAIPVACWPAPVSGSEVLLLTQAPISEPSAMHSDAGVVDAEMLSEITLSARAVSSGAVVCRQA